MSSCKVVADTAINTFLNEQRKLSGEVMLTLVEFDDRHTTRYLRTNLRYVDGYSLNPGGGTALNDAIGYTIDKVGSELAALREADRPSLVVVAIMTDGEENASRKFTSRHIKDKIKLQSEVYNWKFTYLGANQDAFATADTLGIDRASTLNFKADKSAYGGVLSKNVGTMRSTVRAGGQAVSKYTEEDAKEVM
jgi:hypothetical protein